MMTTDTIQAADKAAFILLPMLGGIVIGTGIVAGVVFVRLLRRVFRRPAQKGE